MIGQKVSTGGEGWGCSPTLGTAVLGQEDPGLGVPTQVILALTPGATLGSVGGSFLPGAFTFAISLWANKASSAGSPWEAVGPRL